MNNMVLLSSQGVAKSLSVLVEEIDELSSQGVAKSRSVLVKEISEKGGFVVRPGGGQILISCS